MRCSIFLCVSFGRLCLLNKWAISTKLSTMNLKMEKCGSRKPKIRLTWRSTESVHYPCSRRPSGEDDHVGSMSAFVFMITRSNEDFKHRFFGSVKVEKW